MINTYITAFNEAILAHSTNFKKAVFGIAQSVFSGEDEFPYITENGEDQHVFIDDAYDFGLYHKQKGISYVEDLTKGFGDNKRITEVQDIALIAWGFMDKLTAEEFKDFILSIAPTDIRFVSIILDKKTIFNTEFKGIDFMVNETIFLMQINYKVQYVVKKQCLEINTKFN